MDFISNAWIHSGSNEIEGSQHFINASYTKVIIIITYTTTMYYVKHINSLTIKWGDKWIAMVTLIGMLPISWCSACADGRVDRTNVLDFHSFVRHWYSFSWVHSVSSLAGYVPQQICVFTWVCGFPYLVGTATWAHHINFNVHESRTLFSNIFPQLFSSFLVGFFE